MTIRLNMIDDNHLWAYSNYTFENGDGTRYHLTLCPHQYGGVYVICNDSSLWLFFKNYELRHLCGNKNSWTKKAILQLAYAKKWGHQMEDLV